MPSNDPDPKNDPLNASNPTKVPLNPLPPIIEPINASRPINIPSIAFPPVNDPLNASLQAKLLSNALPQIFEPFNPPQPTNALLNYSSFSEYEATLTLDIFNESKMDLNSIFHFVNQFPCFKKCIVKDDLNSEKELQTFLGLLFLRYVKLFVDFEIIIQILSSFIDNFTHLSKINISC